MVVKCVTVARQERKMNRRRRKLPRDGGDAISTSTSHIRSVRTAKAERTRRIISRARTLLLLYIYKYGDIAGDEQLPIRILHPLYDTRLLAFARAHTSTVHSIIIGSIRRLLMLDQLTFCFVSPNSFTLFRSSNKSYIIWCCAVFGYGIRVVCVLILSVCCNDDNGGGSSSNSSSPFLVGGAIETPVRVNFYSSFLIFFLFIFLFLFSFLCFILLFQLGCNARTTGHSDQ